MLELKPDNLALVIPTLNAGPHLARLLPALAAQTLRPSRFLVVDSSSTDDTVARFRDAGAEVQVIAREDFDHAGTRQMAIGMLDDRKIVIFLTQDAVPAHPEAFAHLVKAFEDERTGVAYGRQLPAPGAGPIAAHARLFNYPAESQVRTMQDAPRFRIKTAFCSNSFAAYRRGALLEAGGFQSPAILSEDMVAAAAILSAGWNIRYVAEARVYHSHDYTTAMEFRRYFDTGVLHARSRSLLERFGGPEGEGWRYIRSELSYLLSNRPLVIPVALLRTASKYLGYRLGRAEERLPLGLKRALSLNRRYWG